MPTSHARRSSRSFRSSVAALVLVTGLGALAVVAAGPAAAATGSVVINEIVSTGTTPDFVELTNTGTAAADISGYRILDADPDGDHQPVVVPGGTVLAPGAFAAFDTDVAGGFGLGSDDSARLFAPDGTTLLDTYSWTQHAATSYGRCPDGTGAFTTTRSVTRGAANDCAPAPVPPVRTDAVTWPGGSTVTVADAEGVLGEDQSGLYWETTAAGPVLWTVQNDPGVLWRLLWDGTRWTPDTADGWAQGKQLRYPDGTGEPDSEGVTLVGGSSAGGVYVATERDNLDEDVSRPTLLRFDVSGSATTLVATAAWDMTADLPAVGANLGFEALTWVPDTALVTGGLRDAATGAIYDPSTYPGHGSGLFLAGLEADGNVYAYALDAAGTRYTRVAVFSSGFPTVMELQWDGDDGVLRAVCDDTCEGQQTVLGLAAGSFAVTAAYARPVGLPDVNDEGFAIAPDTLCADGLKPAVWADDDGTDGHALRQGTVACSVATVAPPTAPGGDTPQTGATAPLAATGAATGAPLLTGLAALTLGLVLLVAGRRRRAF